MKRTTEQKMVRRQNKEGGSHLDQESNRQRTMEGIDGGPHPAVNGQSLGERSKVKETLPLKAGVTHVQHCLSNSNSGIKFT